MKRIPVSMLVFILFLLIALWAKPTHAQSQNRQAMSWFEVGLRETEAQKKIAAYAKACEHDPSFVEAWFNLGMAHGEQKDYTHAEECLRRAYNVKPDRLDQTLKFKIVYELANVYSKQGKPGDYERTLQQAKALARNQETLAMLAFELGRHLYRRQRYDEAVLELQEGRRYVTRDRENYDGLMQLAEKAARWEKLYATAERERASGKLTEARAKFAEIAAGNPEFREVKARLAEVEAQLQSANDKAALAGLYDQARAYEAEGKLALAIATYENLLRQAGNYQDAEARAHSLKQRLEHEQRREKLESAYAAGATALRVRDWAAAITAFETVEALNPGAQDARKKLAQARKALEREGVETDVARYYAEGLAAEQRNDLGGALAAFENVRKFNPNYRDVATRLAEIEKALTPAAVAVASVTAPEVNLDSLYQAALATEQRGDWMQAVLAWEALHFHQPDYRDLKTRLAAARAQIEQPAPVEKAASARRAGNISFYYLAGMSGLMAVLSMLFLLPINHARWHMFRRNYPAAAKVYEKLLTRQPKRVGLYPRLADIYLMQGREDDHALKVFRMVAQLNLATPNRDRIDAIVTQKFLSEGRTDSDAIEIFEKALKHEQQKQKFVNARA